MVVRLLYLNILILIWKEWVVILWLESLIMHIVELQDDGMRRMRIMMMNRIIINYLRFWLADIVESNTKFMNLPDAWAMSGIWSWKVIRMLSQFPSKVCRFSIAPYEFNSCSASYRSTANRWQWLSHAHDLLGSCMMGIYSKFLW